jgi:hypothetical protein
MISVFTPMPGKPIPATMKVPAKEAFMWLSVSFIDENDMRYNRSA